jgi:type II secretory pathway pseudopilin PulG
MSGFRLSIRARLAGFTLVELLIATGISSVIGAALLTGSILVQKSFAASRHHIDAQAEQLRLIDYMGLDLRRALTVTVTATASGSQLALTIPDYYEPDPDHPGRLRPREPDVSKGTVVYGAAPIAVSYYKRDSAIYRKQGTVETALATDVNDFQLTIQDLGQSISMSVTFIPKYQFSSTNRASVREGTATFSTVLLRNKRQK